MTQEDIRQPDGMYHIDIGAGRIVKTPMTKINTSTMETWAAGLIRQSQEAIDHGFGQDHDGTPFTLTDFLFDTHGGAVPWSDTSMKLLYDELVKNPLFVPTMKAFEAKYGDINFPLTWDSYKEAAGL